MNHAEDGLEGTGFDRRVREKDMSVKLFCQKNVCCGVFDLVNKEDHRN
jgi:hypothetical protein